MKDFRRRLTAGLLAGVAAANLVVVIADERVDNGAPTDQRQLSDNALPRRGLFGAQPASVTAKTQEQQALDTANGAVLTRIFPGTAAAEADFKVGDIVVTIDGMSVQGAKDFLKLLGQRNAGETVTLEILRKGETLEQLVTLGEFPQEKDDSFDVVYGHVVSKGVRLRTIATRPKGKTNKLPAVLLLQGFGNHSIDNPFAMTGLTRIAHHLTRNGYVTLRVDRRGCGDSEGAPCHEMDFDTELDGYRQALKAVKSLGFIDKSNVFIFGQSLGGSTGPIIASESPVRGIITHGTGGGTWFDGILTQRRRWAEFDGSSPAEVAERIEREARYWYPLVIEKKTPAEILKADPENRETILRLSDGKLQSFAKPCTWLHQAVERNMGEVWTKVASTPIAPQEGSEQEPVYPRVLNIWGTSDWCAGRRQSEWLTEIVNRANPGHGKFVTLQNSDHFFFRASSMQESFRYFKPPKDGPFGEFNPAILDVVCEWLNETVGTSKQG